MANKIEIQIEAGTDQLIKSLGQADRAAVKFSGTLTKSFSPIRSAAASASGAIDSGFKTAFGTLTKGVAIGNLVSSAILGVAGSIARFVKGSLDAAQTQEDAINRLSQALRASGEFSNAAVRDFEAFASGLQKVSTIGDEVTLGQLAIAKSFGASNEQAKQLVTAAANLSATFGGSLEERVQQLGKSLTGTAGRLGQFIPELQALTKEQLLAGNAIDIVNQKFAGAASNELNTFSGVLKQLTNQVGDFQEELGFFVTGGQGTINVLKSLVSGFEAFTNATRNARKALGIGLNPLEEERAKLKELGIELNNVSDAIIQRQKLAAQASAQGNLQREQVFLKQLADLEARRNELIQQRTGIRQGVRVDQEQGQSVQAKGPAVIVGERELAAQAAAQQALLQQDADFQVQLANIKLQNDELTLAQQEAEFDRLLEFEFQKIEAIRNSELEKAKLIEDAGTRRLTIEQANQKAIQQQELKLAQDAEKRRQTNRNLERQDFNTRIGAVSNFLQAGLALSKENGAAQKALAITQATISTFQGATNALADTRPAQLGPFVAASIVALGLSNVARIAGAKFAQGGIVGGTSFQGDKVQARLNSGEMVLNRNQQRELFNIANNGQQQSGGGSMAEIRAILNEIKAIPIIVQADGREIARLIRDENRNGFEVLA